MSKNLNKKLQEALDSGVLFEIVDNCLAVSQVLQKLGFSAKGQYVQIVRDFLNSNYVDISHFTLNGKPLAVREYRYCPVCSSTFKVLEKDLQITCSKSCSNTYFRTKEQPTKTNYRTRALAHYGQYCALCNYSNIDALQVHHIDGNRSNNNITNLVVLCANCHAVQHKSNKPL